MARKKTLAKADVVIYSKVPGQTGWRRGRLVFSANNRVRPDMMFYNGKIVPIAEDAVYQIRRYEEGKTIYTTVGSDLQAAQTTLDKHILSEQHRKASAALGLIEPNTTAKPTLAGQLKTYIEQKRADKVSPELVVLYERTLTGFVVACGRKYAAEVTQQDVTGFLDRVEIEGYVVRAGSKPVRRTYRQKSMQGRYVAIRGFLHKQCGINVDKLIDRSTHRRRGKKPEPIATAYTQQQMDALLRVMNEYNRAVFTALLLTGMRYCELSHLTWKNVDFERGVIRIVDEEVILKYLRGELKRLAFSTKNGKGRELPIFGSLRTLLLQWREKRPNTTYVFGTRSDLPNGHWLEYLKKCAIKAGVNCGVCQQCVGRGTCEHVTVHRWRHTFAHRCIDGGVPLHQLSRWLGHQDVSITAKVYLNGGTWRGSDPFAKEPLINSAIHSLIR